MDDIIKIIPDKWRGTFLVLAVISPYITRAYHAIAMGGGLRSMLASIWFGTNTPKPKSNEPPVADKLKSWLLVGLVGFGLMFSASGCALFKGNTPAKNAVNISDSARITVEAALGMWDSYIVAHHPPIKQQIAVKQAWQKYQAAQLVVLDAALILKEAQGANTISAQAALNSAIANAGNELADLFNLLRNFGVKL